MRAAAIAILLTISASSPAALAGKPVKAVVATPPAASGVAKPPSRVRRGLAKFGLGAAGIGMMVASKYAHAAGDPATAGALAAGGANTLIMAFNKAPAEHLGSRLGLTAASAATGWIAGSGDAAPEAVATFTSAVTTIVHFVLTASSY
jgi:hypothetical protein